jgi:hypothetical protein
MSTNNTSCRNNIYGSCKCSHNWQMTLLQHWQQQ